MPDECLGEKRGELNDDYRGEIVECLDGEKRGETCGEVSAKKRGEIIES
jgi:hypothetical protein